MLPIGNFNNLYYPMTADIYYATKTQNSLGEMEREWYKDRSINCSAIKENPSSEADQSLKSNKFLEYDIKVNMRTNENIFKSVDGTHYYIPDIIVSNIKDPFGSITWAENDLDSTSFEIEIIEPMFDEFHNVNGYRILLKRSSLQVVL